MYLVGNTWNIYSLHSVLFTPQKITVNILLWFSYCFYYHVYHIVKLILNIDIHNVVIILLVLILLMVAIIFIIIASMLLNLGVFFCPSPTKY